MGLMTEIYLIWSRDRFCSPSELQGYYIYLAIIILVRSDSKLAMSVGKALFSSSQLQAVLASCPSGQALHSLSVQPMNRNEAEGAAFGT